MINFDALPDENSKRFVAVLNRKIESGPLLNCLGHMTAGLVARVEDIENLCFLEYRDRDDGIHPCISHFPFIVLKADNSNKIRKVREEALHRSIPFTDFTDTMTVGTSAAQVAATEEKAEAELEYYGICMFGETEILRQLTGKFSLFR